MPRSTRFRSHCASEFVVESISSDDTKLDSEKKRKKSPSTKKLHKKSKSEKHIGILELSTEEQPSVVIKKRINKRKPKDNISEHAGFERKIVKGRRRLHRQTNVDEDGSITLMQSLRGEQKVSPPKTRLSLKQNRTSLGDAMGDYTLFDVGASATNASPVKIKPMTVVMNSLHKSPAPKASVKTRTSGKLINTKTSIEDSKNNKTFDPSLPPQNIFSIVKKAKSSVANPPKLTPRKTRKSLKTKISDENKENDTFDKLPMSSQKVSIGRKSKSMTLGPLKPLPVIGKISSPKTRLSMKNTMASLGDKTIDAQDDKQPQNLLSSSVKFLKSATTPMKTLFNMDENLIETSVQKYSTRFFTRTSNPLDVTLDASVADSSEVLFRNSTNKYQSISKKRGTFEIANPRASETHKTGPANAFDEPLDESFEDIESTQINDNQYANKRNTFEVQKVHDNLVHKTLMKSKTPARTSLKRLTKRETFEINPQAKDTLLNPGRRSTFDVNPNGLLPSTSNRSKVELMIDSPIVISDSPEASFTTPRLRSSKRDSLKKPTLVVRNSLSSMHKKKLSVLHAQKKKENKIKISDSKTSLSESCISTPSSLLRRVQKLNPASAKMSTPAIAQVKPVSTKKKTVQLSTTSKVKKVPNYSAIHKNAYDKMEAIDDYLERKATRAKALLSGQKASAPVTARLNSKSPSKSKRTLFTSNLVVDNKLKPNIKFTDKGTDSPVIFGDPNKTRSGKSGANTRSSKNVAFSVRTPESRMQPQRYAKTPLPTRDQIWNAYGTKIPRATAPSTATSTWVNTIGDGPIAPLAFDKTAVGIDKKTRLKVVASVSTKSKGSTTTVDSRRDHIKGVRSNRRFDLLMSMRK